MITLESIKEKLGFDPITMEGYPNEEYDEWLTVDKPSVYSVLSLEELLFLRDIKEGKSQEDANAAR